MEERRVIALGFFDGAHKGHKALFEMAKKRAEELSAESAVMSFDTEPVGLITGKRVPIINTPNERSAIIKKEYGIENVIFLHFDRELMNMHWSKFIEWLAYDFHAVHLVIGYDFRCGHGGEGNAKNITEKCAELKIGIDIVPEVTLDGLRISSTYIRELLANGKVWRANQFLGHPHVFSGEVQYGYRFGRTLGIPTINMRIGDGVVRMPNGVYATKSYPPDGKEYMSITNIGVRPTVAKGSSAVSVETHLLGFSGDLYGQRVWIEFYKFLRAERRFGSPHELKTQISKDIADTKQLFEYMKEQG